MATTSLKFNFILPAKGGKKKIKLRCWLVLVGKENNTQDSLISDEHSTIIKASSGI